MFWEGFSQHSEFLLESIVYFAQDVQLSLQDPLLVQKSVRKATSADSREYKFCSLLYQNSVLVNPFDFDDVGQGTTLITAEDGRERFLKVLFNHGCLVSPVWKIESDYRTVDGIFELYKNIQDHLDWKTAIHGVRKFLPQDSLASSFCNVMFKIPATLPDYGPKDVIRTLNVSRR